MFNVASHFTRGDFVVMNESGAKATCSEHGSPFGADELVRLSGLPRTEAGLQLQPAEPRAGRVQDWKFELWLWSKADEPK